VPILVPGFNTKYPVGTGQSWHIWQMVQFFINTVSSAGVIPYLRSLILKTSTMVRITYAKRARF
jgi:hypothetical protein